MNTFAKKILLSMIGVILTIGSSSTMQENDIGYRYLEFLRIKNPSLEEMSQIFTPNCHKIINRAIAAKNSEEMRVQICSVQQEFEQDFIEKDVCWTVEPNEEYCFFAPDQRKYLLQFYVEVPHRRISLTVIAYLKIDEDGKICEINEVYSEKEY